LVFVAPLGEHWRLTTIAEKTPFVAEIVITPVYNQMSTAGKPGVCGTTLEEDTEQAYENVLAEIQSFELPIEATLR
jgi:hypothetical protein